MADRHRRRMGPGRRRPMDRFERRDRHPEVRWRLVGLLAILVSSACRPNETTMSTADTAVLNPPARLQLRPVTLPDFSKMEAPAREQMQARATSLNTRLGDRSASRVDLGSAYG